MKHRFLLGTAACVMALGAAVPAMAQSDLEVRENADAYSASVCPDYSKDVSMPMLRGVPVGALRVLAQRGIVLCQSPQLTADAPVVWYGQYGVYAWNPYIDGAATQLVAVIDNMTRNESFPVQMMIWDTNGVRLTGRTVPAFQLRPGARLRVQSR
ncbi:hypothetical protein FXN63_21935 [Pigmentiphaga aceris]|uniref:Uncharacterized protein n=1 Tax=Pigmentiphaga aceris TaxID=1940612 RepID=A0A5C0B0M5_9BURK|nr:hypothetical protein [Pigmentiphaga aceris]QEI08202.1 hypothetical protein FXN63_21935 [Pigmentiphaga aceris]